jgi:NTE family protein
MPPPHRLITGSGPDCATIGGVTAIGLVLSAGGATGDPWHSGVLTALHDETGWDARHAPLIVGTSAGAITAVGLRAGISAVDRHAGHLGLPMSESARAILDRIVTPWAEERVERDWRPQSPALTLKASWPLWSLRPLHLAVGLMPAGSLSAERLRTRMDELHPGPWTDVPTWIPAVRLADGRRVVFGRDDAEATLGQAIHASCSVPGVYQPVAIGESRYVDGGVHSSTNADLLAPLGFDLVVISSCMTAVPGSVGFGSLRPTRAWMARKLAAEVAEIRRTGTPVLVVQPTNEALEVIEQDPSESGSRDIAKIAHTTTLSRLARRDGKGLASLVARAAVDG